MADKIIQIGIERSPRSVWPVQDQGKEITLPARREHPGPTLLVGP